MEKPVKILWLSSGRIEEKPTLAPLSTFHAQLFIRISTAKLTVKPKLRGDLTEISTFPQNPLLLFSNKLKWYKN
jgi:hypothetical protein